MANKDLEIKRKEVELKRVETAREEIELKIFEREDEIQRLKENIVIQKEKEASLREELDELKH